MPIQGRVENGIIHTVLEGQLTDDELLAYYLLPMFQDRQPPWLEVVDGRLITQMEVTANGQRQLGVMALQKEERLRGGRVAMVAPNDLTYGMFRMWEMIRPDIDYEIRVFRDFQPGWDWVAARAGGV